MKNIVFKIEHRDLRSDSCFVITIVGKKIVHFLKVYCPGTVLGSGFKHQLEIAPSLAIFSFRGEENDN